MERLNSENKRIARNTFMLYFRMIFLMLISIYTSRIILQSLGAEDYGIYNVVGGVVAMFVFVNYAMINATQRYITFELGKNNYFNLNKVFCLSFNIHLIIGLIVLVLVETIGIWFLYNKLVIPENRMSAAFWVLQFSAISTFLSIISVPYNSLIIAYERMSAFAYISIFNGLCKLLVSFIICYTSSDRLIVFAMLLFVLSIVNTAIYIIYCRRHFSVSRYHLIFDASLSKEMIYFAGWNIIGNLAYVCATQGINILLNIFFNPIVNAARGLAVQVQTAVTNFSTNIEMAIKPQITKSYAANDYSRLKTLTFASARYSYYALLIISLPLMIEINYVLRLWLKDVPNHTGNFVILIIITTLIDSLSNPLLSIIQATGNVKRYQLVVGLIYLSILPLSYIALNYFPIPEIVFITNLSITAFLQIIKISLVSKYAKIPSYEYFKKVYIKPFIVTIIALLILIIPHTILKAGFIRLLIVSFSSVFSLTIVVYYIGLTNNERDFVNTKINNFITKISNK